MNYPVPSCSLRLFTKQPIGMGYGDIWGMSSHSSAPMTDFFGVWRRGNHDIDRMLVLALGQPTRWVETNPGKICAISIGISTKQLGFLQGNYLGLALYMLKYGEICDDVYSMYLFFSIDTRWTGILFRVSKSAVSPSQSDGQYYITTVTIQFMDSAESWYCTNQLS